MYLIVLFSIIGIVCSAKTFESNLSSNRSLTVMAFIAEPFVIYDRKSTTLKGLDVDIIKIFAKKFNLHVKFLLSNESLNELFETGMVEATRDQRQIFLESVSQL